jgi:hypothetical protein
MKKLTEKVISQQIRILNANLPNPQPIDILEIRIITWISQLSHISEEVFIKAVNYHISISPYFPTVKDILDAYKYVIDHTPKPFALPEPQIKFTPEEEAERKELIRKFKEKRKKIGAI